MPLFEKLQRRSESAMNRIPLFGLSRKRTTQILRGLVLFTITMVLVETYLHSSFWESVTHDRGTLVGDTYSEGQLMLAQPPVSHMKKNKKQIGKEKATLLMLVRNKELDSALASMRKIEDRFNRNFHYPWTFMNDKPFTPEFITRTTGLASGPVEFVHIPKSDWSMPKGVNGTRIREGMLSLIDEGVIYAGSVSYRHMCRFNSGFFMHQKALLKYDWYWRVEPDIEMYCDVTYDPFTFLRTTGKVYGFVLSMYEFAGTITSLWDETKAFVAANPQYLAADNALPFISDDPSAASQSPADRSVKGDYNLCHFWSNFEIASLDFFRGEAYTKYFEHLDNAGGFFYERWGDAPVHTLALSLFLPRNKIHHFADIGYKHSHAARCPQDDASHDEGRCVCDRENNYDTDSHSCAPRWFKLNGAGLGA